MNPQKDPLDQPAGNNMPGVDPAAMPSDVQPTQENKGQADFAGSSLDPSLPPPPKEAGPPAPAASNVGQAEPETPTNAVPGTTFGPGSAAAQPVVGAAETPPVAQQSDLPQPTVMGMKQDPLPVTGHRRRKKGLVIGLIVAALLLILSAGAAASYYFVAVNNPDNILKQALANSLDLDKAKTVQISGDFKWGDKSDMDVASTYKGSFDNITGAFDISGKADLLVTNLTFDLRAPDSKSFFFRVGGLDGLAELMGLGGEAGAIYAPIIDSVNNQWIEINESFLKEADNSYVSSVLSKADARKVQDAYLDHPFLVVKEVLADEAVNGTPHYHYKMSIDSAKLKDFVTALKNANLDSYKFDQKKVDEFKKQIDAAKLDKYPFELWISKADKMINQVAMKFEQDGSTFDFRMKIDSYNKPVKVEKPSDAKSILEVLGDLFGGSALMSEFQMPAELESGISL